MIYERTWLSVLITVDSTSENENEEFCCVFRSRLGAQSIVYGAEMDGFRLKSDQDGRDLDFLDLNRYFAKKLTLHLITKIRNKKLAVFKKIIITTIFQRRRFY